MSAPHHMALLGASRGEPPEREGISAGAASAVRAHLLGHVRVTEAAAPASAPSWKDLAGPLAHPVPAGWVEEERAA